MGGVSVKTLPINTWVIAGRDLGIITKVGRHAGADGCWIASSTDDPGASAFSLPTLRVELNGAGSVVAHLYPMGLEGGCDCGDDDGWESPRERVERLTAALKEAKKALPRKAKSGAR